MNINRHNYEEYFILYADNELGSNERRMVENFISANPDLKDELDIYLKAILKSDTKIGFGNKEDLFRYDESLVAYVDDELGIAEKAELEKLIAASPALQTELELYRKTKLQPETDIVFENKSLLYRSTERRRVIPMTFIRWSVAAAVLLAVLVTAVTIFKNNPDKPQTAGINEEKIIAPVNDPAVKSDLVKEGEKGNTPIEPVTSPIEPLLSEKQIPQNSTAQADNRKKTILPIEKKQELLIISQEKKPEIAVINQPPSNNLPSPQNNSYINPDNQKAGSSLAVNDSQKEKDPVTIPATDPYNNQKATDKGDAIAEPQFASLEDGGQNKKSRGFFRKLTRVFEKNTGIKATTDDDKLHIAAFTVKLK